MGYVRQPHRDEYEYVYRSVSTVFSLNVNSAPRTPRGSMAKAYDLGVLENTTKARLKSGHAVFGCFTKYRDPAFAELASLQGWDFLVFDGEHGALSPADVENLSRAVEVRGVTPLARVPRNEPSSILSFLDRGIHGVHVPWVNSAAEVEQAVRSVKYGPRGSRGLAGGRASDWGTGESIGAYTERANRETLVVIHIETAQAVDAIGDYVDVDDVDVLFLGPTDLSHSLGHPGEVDHPEVVAAMEVVAEAVISSEKALGIYAPTVPAAQAWLERGARYITAGAEGFVAQGMAAFIAQLRR